MNPNTQNLPAPLEPLPPQPDLYTKEAAQYFNVPYEAVTPKMRAAARLRIFSQIYGYQYKETR